MKKTLSAVLIAACLGGGYTAASWYFGKQTEATLSAQYDKLLEKTPYVKILQRDYQRGVFKSTETMTLEIVMEPSPSTAQAATDDQPTESKPLTLMVHSDIRHGPIPDLSAVATAATTTEVKLTDDAAAELSGQLAGKTLFTQQMLIHLDGSGHATFSSPELALTIPNSSASEADLAVTLDWQGMSGEMDFSADMEQLTLNAVAPSVNVTDDEGGKIHVSGIQMSSVQEKLYQDVDSIYAGNQHITVDEVSVATPEHAQTPVVIKQIAYDVDLAKEGDFLNVFERMGVEKLQLGQNGAGPFHFDISFKHLHGRTFAEFSQALVGLNAELSKFADEQSAFDESLMPVIKEHGQRLLDHNPEIHIDRVSFATGDGEALLTGQIRIDALNIDAAMENPFLVLPSLVASGEFSVDENMVLELLRNPPQSELLGNTDEESAAQMAANAQMMAAQFQQQVAMFTDMGYITREGSLLKTQVSFEAGQLLVNGQPFMPMAQPDPMEDESGDMEAEPSLMEDDAVSMEVDPALIEEPAAGMEAEANLQ
ncbi:MAG: YdgA family protein [Candidatus Thiodiazotropha sp.]|jgi:uncharacterized protein YdgA (DUF945 family)